MAAPNRSTYRTTVFPLSNPEGQQRWQALLAASPQASPFASLPYARALQTHTDVTASLWFASNAATDLAGVLVFSRRKGPFKRVLVPGFTQYTSLLLAAPADTLHEPLLVLLNALAAAYDDLRFHLHPAMDDIRVLNWIKWQVVPYFTYLIDLKTYDLSKSDWSSSTRRNFNKHTAAYTIEEDIAHAGSCIALCAAGYTRSNRPFPMSPDALNRIAADLHAQQMVRTFVAIPQGEKTPRAGVVVLQDARRAHYWIAGSDPGPAMTVLIGHMLETLKASGIHTFDFVGANTPRIAEFKRRFGPTLTPYYAGMATPNRTLSTLLKLKRTLLS